MSLQKDFVPILLAVGLLSVAVSFAEETPRKDDFRIAWLKQHAIPLRSIDPNDEDFTDLEPLVKIFKDIRIVQLGEQSHGDGATFHAKTRLIKFLHQKLFFDVLAFESGLYDCRKAWELLQGGMEPYKAFSHGVLSIWSRSEQVRLLIDYWGRVAKSQQPLELCGFDCQPTGKASPDLLIEDVNALWNKLGPAVPAAGQRAAVSETLSKLDPKLGHWYEPGPQERQQWHQAIAAWCKSLETARPSDALPQAELEFWRRVAACYPWLTAIWGHRPNARQRNFRDQQMASNLVWLARTVYPKRKIIVWAASAHLERNPLPEWGVKMGHEVWKVLGTQTYTVGFTAAEGEYKGWFWDKAWQLEPPAPGSLEDLFVRAGFDNAFLDFRHLGSDGAWLKEKLIARPFGYSNDEANWTDMLDGIVFTKKMFPSTKRKED